MSAEHIQEAFDLAQRFHQSQVYQAVREGEIQREQAVSLTVGGLTLNGVVDLVGHDFVLDFKTDSDMQPHHHQFQLWAYGKATGKSTAYLAYLRHDQLHPFDGKSLTSLNEQASMLIEKLMAGDFTPTVNHTSCGMCSYSEICGSRINAPR